MVELLVVLVFALSANIGVVGTVAPNVDNTMASKVELKTPARPALFND